MRTNFNKKKITFISIAKLFKHLLIILTLLLITFFIYNEFFEKKRYKEVLQKFSEKNSYLLTSYKINDLIRVDKSEVSQIISKYFGESIFLISLKSISNEIRDLNWVKNVNLSNNFKNKITVEILEYEPIGLFFFNNKFYYFSAEAKIITQSKDNIEKFIIFSGKNSLNHAAKLLDSIKSMQSSKLNNIVEAHYVNNRRWNLKFSDQLVILLPEKDIETSLNSYIKLLDQLDESEILLIQSIDLRNYNKAIIKFKKND